MRFQEFFFVFFTFMVSLLLIKGQRPVNFAMRRKLHRHNCLQRRWMPLHSQVLFP
ncbi:apelin receptor early endogenous ligand-like [Trichechus manatus latirostris]|uniref:Apelin receptor early endogenous ligand-like n=1 Tax=Trichechus manatus latirostris TaxID=127582 RepID=A0A2Y9QNC5_TRIMA|nr:apelin receptor early endogenous ligand-like [Trichechus manatus latirostris]